MKNITSKTFQGLKWTTLATILTAVMQIGYTAVMARLLNASDFGLVALGNVTLRFAQYFSNMGMTQAIIQKKELDKNDINAAFSFAIILGISFFAIIYSMAPLFSVHLFKNAELIPVLRALAISFILTSLSSIPLSLLKRKLQFKTLSKIEVFSYLLSYGIVGIGMGYMGFGVWSLVFASLGQGLIMVIFGQFAVSHKFKLLLKWIYYKPLFAYGSRISFINFLGFLSTNSDTMIIGRILGASSLGFYNRAFSLINLPAIFFIQSISKVLFPALSTIQADFNKLKKVFRMSIATVGFLLFPTCFGASIASHEIVLVMLGDKWVESISILSILAFATPFNLLTVFAGIILEVTAKLKIKIIFQCVFLLTMLTMFYFLHGYGLVGFALAILISNFANHVIYTIYISIFLKINVREILSIYAPGVVTSIIVAGLIYLDNLVMDQFNASLVISFFSEIGVGAIALLGSLFLPINRIVRNKIVEHLSGSFSNSKFVSRVVLILR